MPLAHQTALLSIHDAKVRAVLTDPAGGTPTYGTWIDIPDVTGCTLEGDTDVKTRRGDGAVRARRQVHTGLTVTLENTTLPFDVLELLEGGTVADAGTTPNQTVRYTYGKTSIPQYVEFSAQCENTDFADGAVTLTVYKCQLNNKIPLGFTDDDFQTYSYELGGVARNSDGLYYEILAEETATAIDAA